MALPLMMLSSSAAADPVHLPSLAGTLGSAVRPVVRLLSIPSAEQGWRHRWHRWAATLPTGLRRHTLQPDGAHSYRALFRPTQTLRERFGRVFDLRQGAEGIDYPVLLSVSVLGVLQDRVLADLGVDRRHVQEVRHHIRLPAGATALAKAPLQDLACQLLRVVRVSDCEALVMLETRISTGDGLLLAVVEDGLLVSHLRSADTLRAAEDDLLRQTIARTRRRRAGIDGTGVGVRARQLYIADDARRQFRSVAGDSGRPSAADNRRPVRPRRGSAVPGTYLRNLVARELAEWGLAAHSLMITFTGPVHPRQMVQLLVCGQDFEVVDASGGLVAYGKAR